MSIRAGSIVTVGGRNVIDRLQQAGIQNPNIPIETIRETGNDLVVDKVLGEADLTFTMESWDVTTDMLAFLQGKVGASMASNAPPGAADAANTEYRWENCQMVNIVSPWKGDTGSQGGHIVGGVIIPAYYPTRLSYRLGATENAACTVELSGGSYYMAGNGASPVEEYAAGDGTETEFVTSEPARGFRVGGLGGTTFTYVFGVIVNGTLQQEGVDYTVTDGVAPPGVAAAVTITFEDPPANAAQVRYCYFTTTAKTIPQAQNATTAIKPGALRGRDIEVLVGEDGSQVKLRGVQTFQLDATVEGEVDREMGTFEPIGRAVTGTDVTGSVVIRPAAFSKFLDELALVTGLPTTEVYGFLNQESAPVEIKLLNPSDHGETIKSIYVEDGLFTPPPPPAQVNQAVDLTFAFNSRNGSFSEFKGGRA